MFSAGKSQVVLVDPAVPAEQLNKDYSTVEHMRSEVEKTISIIDPSQRPQIVFVEDLKKMKLSESQRLAPVVPIEELDGKPCIIDPERHFIISSKQELAVSGLNTPPCEIIDFSTPITTTSENCCGACCEYRNSEQVTKACVGPRRLLLEKETSKTLHSLYEKPLPYILKLQQTQGATGAFWVGNRQELDEVAQFIATTYLPNNLPKLNERNVHLRPINILLSEIVRDGLKTQCPVFFVKRNGQFIFLGCNTQKMVNGHWSGSMIRYEDQAALQKQLHPTLQKVGEYLHSKGYHGAAGVDVIEDQSGEQWVVDLNVRPTGSIILSSLKKHFTSRGLQHACLIPGAFGTTRVGFRDRIGISNIRDGRVMITAWFEINRGHSVGRIVIGAETADALQDEVDRVTALMLRN